MIKRIWTFYCLWNAINLSILCFLLLLVIFLFFNSLLYLLLNILLRFIGIQCGENCLPVIRIRIEIILDDFFNFNNLFVLCNSNLFRIEVEISIVSVEKPIPKEKLRHSFYAFYVCVAIICPLCGIVLFLRFTWPEVACLKVVLLFDWVGLAS